MGAGPVGVRDVSLDCVPLLPSGDPVGRNGGGRDTSALPNTNDHFDVLDADWTVQSVESLPSHPGAPKETRWA